MFRLPGSIGFATPVSSMHRLQCLINEAHVVIFAQNSVENAAVVPLFTCRYVHEVSVSVLHMWVVDNSL